MAEESDGLSFAQLALFLRRRDDGWPRNDSNERKRWNDLFR